MQQHFKEAQRHKQQYVSEEIERMGQPFSEDPERNPVHPLQGEPEPPEEISRAQKCIKQMAQIHSQHSQQDLQPDVPFVFQYLSAENKSHQRKRV